MQKPVLFLTTSTSGTGSLRRIISKLIGENRLDYLAHDFYERRALPEMRKYHPGTDPGKVYNWSTPEHWNTDLDLSKYHLLVNFRDPRDILCNQYFWSQSHPQPGLSAEQVEAKRREIRDAGIDAYVLNSEKDHGGVWTVCKAYDKAKSEDRSMISYAQLCLDFDGMLATLCRVLEVDLTADVASRFDDERVEKLMQNPAFMNAIGDWQGKDFSPGRHKTELKPDTIEILNKRFAKPLAFFREHDSKMAEHY